MLKKAKWIWIKENGKDTYAEFYGAYIPTEGEKVKLSLACDGSYAVYINEELAMFGQSGDYPDCKLVDKKDVTKYSKVNKLNTLKIVVWHYGAYTQNYIDSGAGVFFELKQGKELLVVSDHNTGARLIRNYKNGYCKYITNQLGYSFCYDNSIENDAPYQNCIEQPDRVMQNRNVPTLKLQSRKKNVVTKLADNVILIDLKRETCGFLDLQFISPVTQKLHIRYAEHLVDGRVQNVIGNRDFSVEFIAKAGQNTYLNALRRLAGRYLEIHSEQPIEVQYIGLRQVMRPLVNNKVTFNDKLLQKIYDISVTTLKMGMHEHYEDCPWREQCMYLMDSRNQLLCSYYAFKGHTFQRENILFFAKGQREDGMFSICFPTSIDIPIPSFSLAYPMIVYEYITHTGDTSILQTVKPCLDKLIKTFQNKVEENGLIANFKYPYWNFYEWAPQSDNDAEILRKPDEYNKEYHLILNCMYVLACNYYTKIFGEKFDTEVTKNAIKKVFYVPEKGLYKLNTANEYYSRLGNSLALLIGLGGEELAEKVINDESLIEITLSMNTFYYDALLQFGDKYKQFVLQDMVKKYNKMLNAGATTFWETELGWKDFDGAGSMSHGWSAMPIYYLTKLCK